MKSELLTKRKWNLNFKQNENEIWNDDSPELGLLERIRDASVEPSCNTTILILGNFFIINKKTKVLIPKTSRSIIPNNYNPKEP